MAFPGGAAPIPQFPGQNDTAGMNEQEARMVKMVSLSCSYHIVSSWCLERLWNQEERDEVGVPGSKGKRWK